MRVVAVGAGHELAVVDVLLRAHTGRCPAGGGDLECTPSGRSPLGGVLARGMVDQVSLRCMIPARALVVFADRLVVLQVALRAAVALVADHHGALGGEFLRIHDGRGAPRLVGAHVRRARTVAGLAADVELVGDAVAVQVGLAARVVHGAGDELPAHRGREAVAVEMARGAFDLEGLSSAESVSCGSARCRASRRGSRASSCASDRQRSRRPRC